LGRSHRTGAAKTRGIPPAKIFCTFPLESLNKMRFGTAKEEAEAALSTGTSVGGKIQGTQQVHPLKEQIHCRKEKGTI